MLKFIRRIFNQLLERRDVLLAMTIREIKRQYIGSSLGFVWTILQPLILLGMYWMVFGIAFKAQPVLGIPYFLWIGAGLANWFFFIDVVNGATWSIVGNSNLIKKTLFPAYFLPLIRIVSGIATHLIFISLLYVILWSQGFFPSFYDIQLLYYLFATIVFTSGIALLCASLQVFFRDVAPIVQVVTQLLFWATPIFWDISMMPERFRGILSLNPIAYLVHGYRDSMLLHIPFWDHPSETLSFWLISFVLLFLGGYTFKKLRPHFGDVL
jgi:lipopolysaccharide transport system permease protein